jgi:hypothetical protein
VTGLLIVLGISLLLIAYIVRNLREDDKVVRITAIDPETMEPVKMDVRKSSILRLPDGTHAISFTKRKP